MFIFVDGVMGSGKSYYAVDYIYKNAAKYETVYTNINGFKFNRILSKTKNFIWGLPYSKYPDLLRSYSIFKFISSIHWHSPVNVKPLNWNSILDVIEKCYDIYTQADLDLDDSIDEVELDSLFIDYLLSIGFISKNSQYKIYKEKLSERSKLPYFKKLILDLIKPIRSVPEYTRVLLTIDEAYNYFDKTRADKLLTWFISYSRHMYIDAILLSQDSGDVNQTYLKRMEYFLRAIPAKRQLLKNKFKYNKHIKYPFYDGKGGTGAGAVIINKSKKVFSLYKSGDSVDGSSVYTRYIIYAALFLLFVGLGLYTFIDRLSSPYKEKHDQTQQAPTQTQSSVIDVSNASQTVQTITSYGGMSYLKFDCVVTTCTNKQRSIVLDINDLNSTVVNTQSKFMNIKKYSDSLASVTILASAEFLNLFQGAKNENKQQSTGFTLLP